MRRFARFACIDWSGARTERLAGIAIAACEDGDEAPQLVDGPLASGRWSRQAILDWLLAHAGSDLLVGCDFSTALPYADAGDYFPGDPRSPADARALWAQVDALCAADPHLAATGYVTAFARYFRVGARTGSHFVHPGARNGRLRRVERAAASGNPASCFNLVGAKQVGRSSLTGMRVLHRLAGRVAVWPFDPVPAQGATLVEIYTSIAACAAGRPAGRAKITDGAALDAALAAPAIASRPYGRTGAMDDHSTDAILTAAWLRRAASDPALWSPAALDEVRDTEGWTFGVP